MMDDDQTAARKQEAITLVNDGQFGRARELLAGICVDSHGDPENWVLLGMAHGGLDSLDEAVECFRRAIALQADYANAHYNLGVCFIRQKGRASEAAASLSRSIQLGNHSQEARDLFMAADLAVTQAQSMRVRIAGDIELDVPASLQLITPYVLLVQEDWFEKEIHFVRRFLGRGMHALDIGANYGVYALTMGACVGETGGVWAFEPADATVGHLRKSIACSHLSHVHVLPMALSDYCGQGQLAIESNSELNNLRRDSDSAVGVETVTVTTLDECARIHVWPGLDFIKLDAEGAVENILTGGRNLLASQDPVVMFEVRRQGAFNLALVRRFAELGYDIYRLVPGPCVLVPFNPEDPLDEFELNLFACKSARALVLERDQLLVRDFPAPHGTRDAAAALDWFSEAQDETVSVAQRVGALAAALDAAESAVRSRASVPRYATLARIAADAGMRMRALYALGEIMSYLQKGEGAVLDEPFVAPVARFDTIERVYDLGWIRASTIEGIACLAVFST